VGEDRDLKQLLQNKTGDKVRFSFDREMNAAEQNQDNK